MATIPTRLVMVRIGSGLVGSIRVGSNHFRLLGLDNSSSLSSHALGARGLLTTTISTACHDKTIKTLNTCHRTCLQAQKPIRMTVLLSSFHASAASRCSSTPPSSDSSSTNNNSCTSSAVPTNTDTNELEIEIVYEGQLTDRIMATRLFSLFSSGILLIAQPVVWARASELNSVFLQAVIGGVLSFFFLGTPLLLHAFSKKYVTTLTLDPTTKTFEAETISFFLRKKKLVFKQSDVEIPATPLPFSTLLVKGKPLVITSEGFKSRFAYDHLMCLDKYHGLMTKDKQ